MPTISQQQSQMPPASTPAETPSCPPCKPLHHRFGFWLTVSIALALLVAAVIMNYFAIQEQQNYLNRIANLEEQSGQLYVEKASLETELATQLQSIPPFFWQEEINFDASQHMAIHRIDPLTGEDTVVFEGPYRLLATPRIQYDGRIFLTRSGVDGPSPPVVPVELTIETGETNPVSYADQFPRYIQSGAVAVSPDGTKIAVAYDNPLESEGILADKQKSVWVYNLLKGEGHELINISDEEYLSRENGPNTFAGAGEFSLEWTSNSCVRTRVFEDNPDAENPDIKRPKESRTACEA